MKEILLLCLTLHSCSLWKNYPQDNIGEEVVEAVIFAKTGMDFDLSPATPEK